MTSQKTCQKTETIPSYAVAYLRNVDFGADIIRYMQEIDATLLPFGGEFIVHGGDLDVREGQWDGTLVIIRFPEADGAAAWYASADYQRIVALRLDNSTSMAALVAGVEPGHTGRKKVDELLGR